MLNSNGKGLAIFDQFVIDKTLPKYNENGEMIITNAEAGQFLRFK